LFVTLLPIIYGVKNSYSAYYNENPTLFVGFLCLLALGFFRSKGHWIKAGYFLVLTAFFDTYRFEIIHYVVAINFFLICMYIMINDKRFSYLGKASLLLIPLAFQNMLIFEAFQVVLIIIFNILYTLKLKRL
jgi:hypothetical protein|tara:strand:- start:777 stop:1172 length:396 start_codon:yes stop_codon:yes gene_type:complete